MKRIKFLGKINKGLKASFVYIICSLLTKGLSIITVPIFTRLLSTSEMGVVNLFASWQSMIASFATLSLTSGGYMLALKEFRQERDSYMSSILTLTSIVAMVLCMFFSLSPSFWTSILGLSESLCILMLLTFLFTPATEFWLARQRYEYKYSLAGIIIVIPAILAAVFSIAAILFFSNRGENNLGEIRIFSSYSITLCVAFFLWIKIMFKGNTFYKKKYWIYSLRLSIPLIGNSVAMQILSISDRVMISKMVGNSALGIYSILYTVSSLSLIVWTAINSSYVPYLFENIEKKDKRSEIRRTSKQLLILYGVAAFFLTIVAPEIVKLLATEEYYEAIYIMPPVAAGIYLTSISNMYSNLLIYYKKTQYIMLSSGIAASINIGLNFICIPEWGYMAAAYTTLVSYVVLAGIQGFVSARICNKMECSDESVYDHKSLLRISALVIISCLIGLSFYQFYFIRYILVLTIMFISLWFKRNLLSIIRHEYKQ